MSASLISVGQVVDQSFHHYRKYFKTLMGISLYLFAGMPFLIAGTLVFDPVNTTRLVISVACEAIGFIATFIASYWILNALILSIDAQNNNKKSNASAVAKSAWQMFAPSFVVSILIAAMLLSTLILLLPGWLLFFIPSQGSYIVPGIGVLLFVLGGIAAIVVSAWISVTFIFAPYSLMLENTKIIGSLKRARDLVRGRWWPVMLRVIIPKLTILVVALFLQYVSTIILSLLSAGSGPDSLLFFIILSKLAQVAFSVLVTPIFLTADYYVFRSLVETAGKKSS